MKKIPADELWLLAWTLGSYSCLLDQKTVTENTLVVLRLQCLLEKMKEIRSNWNVENYSRNNIFLFVIPKRQFVSHDYGLLLQLIYTPLSLVNTIYLIVELPGKLSRKYYLTLLEQDHAKILHKIAAQSFVCIFHERHCCIIKDTGIKGNAVYFKLADVSQLLLFSLKTAHCIIYS